MHRHFSKEGIHMPKKRMVNCLVHCLNVKKKKNRTEILVVKKKELSVD